MAHVQPHTAAARPPIRGSSWTDTPSSRGSASPQQRAAWPAAAAGVALGVCLGASASLLFLRLLRRRRARQEQAEADARAAPPLRSEVIVLGCGSSTGVPRATCATELNSSCYTCRLAVQGPSVLNRNWRTNPSLLVRLVQPLAANAAPGTIPSVLNLQIDCGKTFLSQCLSWYPRYGVRSLDGVLLTHEHADAILGLDDIRSMQRFVPEQPNAMGDMLTVHCSAHTLASVRAKFGYLCSEQQASAALGGFSAASASAASIAASSTAAASASVVERRVASLSWSVMRPFVPLRACGLDIIPLPVMHGEDYVSQAFLFGTGLGQRTAAGARQRDACLYVSDISRVPQITWTYLCTGALPDPPTDLTAGLEPDWRAAEHERAQWYERFARVEAHALRKGEKWAPVPASPQGPRAESSDRAGSDQSVDEPPRLSLVIVDALFPEQEHNTHFNLPQALEFIERLQPKRALITGMSDLFEYERDNAELIRRRRSGELTVDVQLAHDGMRISLDL